MYDNEIARKKIDYFTFNNIKGRSGRMFQHFVGKVFLFDHPPQEQLPFVDMPIVTQGENTPNSLLIQLDDEDLSDKSKQRLERFYSDDIIPFPILKENSGIDPSEQIEAAKSIISDNKLDLLRWTTIPTWDQLLYICTLIWSCFVRSRRNGISSGKQLAYKLKDLSKRHTFPERIETELVGDYAASSVDEAVERVLQFDRNWASYDFPRYLMALDNIQRYLLSKRKIPPGDYKIYAAKVESLFSSPLLQAFDEFGIPPDTGKKLIRIYNIPSNIDDAIERLKHININTDLFDDFEIDVLRDALSTI